MGIFVLLVCLAIGVALYFWSRREKKVPRPNTVVFFRPSYEVATEYLAEWFAEVKEQVPDGVTVVADLYASEANKESLETVLRNVDPVLFLGGGHGDNRRLAGQNTVVAISGPFGSFINKEGEGKTADFSNLELFAGRIVYALSCSFGCEAGPSMVSYGAQAFLGYKVNFTFLIDVSSRTIRDDVYARAFMEYNNQVALSLLRNRTVYDSRSEAYAVRNAWIDHWEASEDEVAVEVIKWLLHDDLVVYGNQLARISGVATKVSPLAALILTLILLRIMV